MPNYHVKLDKPDGTVQYRTAYQNCGKNGFFYLLGGKRKSISEADLIPGKNPKRRNKRRTSRYRKCVRKDGKSGRPKRRSKSRRKSRSKSKKVMKKNCRKTCRKRHSRSKRKTKKCVKSCNKRYSRKRSKGSKKKSKGSKKKSKGSKKKSLFKSKSLPVVGHLPQFQDLNRRRTSPAIVRGSSFNLGRPYNALPARRNTVGGVPLSQQGRPLINKLPSVKPQMNKSNSSWLDNNVFNLPPPIRRVPTVGLPQMNRFPSDERN